MSSQIIIKNSLREERQKWQNKERRKIDESLNYLRRLQERAEAKRRENAKKEQEDNQAEKQEKEDNKDNHELGKPLNQLLPAQGKY